MSLKRWKSHYTSAFRNNKYVIMRTHADSLPGPCKTLAPITHKSSHLLSVGSVYLCFDWSFDHTDQTKTPCQVLLSDLYLCSNIKYIDVIKIITNNGVQIRKQSNYICDWAPNFNQAHYVFSQSRTLIFLIRFNRGVLRRQFAC